MTSPALLGPIRKYERGLTAEVGKWLVVFARNRATSLYPTGVMVSKIRGRAPIVGGSVATLDTTPHQVRVSVKDAQTRDKYFLPEIEVRLSVRLDPEAPGAEAQLIKLINKDAAQLFGSIEACIRDDVSAQVRQAIAKADSIDVVKQGAQKIIFPDSKVKFTSARCVELRALDQVDFQEPAWAAQVRQAAEQATAAVQSFDSVALISEIESKHAHHAAGLSHSLALTNQTNEAELERNRLAELKVRADLLGIDLLAIAEPAVWGQITGQRHELLKTMLEQPHLARHIRTNPQLAQAVLQQLGGGTSGSGQSVTSPLMTRRADVLIDAANPSGMRQLMSGSGVLSTSESAADLRQIPLVIDRWVEHAWSVCGGAPALTGAALSVTLDRMKAFVVLMAEQRPVVPKMFKSELIRTLGSAGGDLTKIEGVLVAGSTLEDAIRKVVQVIAGNTVVNPIMQMRQTEGRREVLIEVSGAVDAASAVYEKLTDPDYPGLQALENLANKQVRIRAIPPANL